VSGCARVPTLVAEKGDLRSKNARTARNEGRGERDKLSLISEGQQKPAGVLGPESTPHAIKGR
jgi:hypothetical protein